MSTTEITRDYVDNFSIKESVIDELIPKYFPDEDISTLNVGLIGLTSELIANTTEDTFNTVSTLMKEIYPNRAQLPETIHSNAAIFQVSNIFSKPSICSFLIILKESDIIANFKQVNGFYYFYLDKNTIVYVKDIPFSLDYDIELKAKKNSDGLTYTFSAQYIMDTYNNTVSEINDPYIKIRRTVDGYLVLQVNMHQCIREYVYETIVNNTKVNFPIINIPFSGKLAGFDVLYKSPEETEFRTQMTKRLLYTPPLKTPFCYYKMTDENSLAITFTTKDLYFQPKFNSELKVILYLTDGEAGLFDVYNGSEINITVDDTESYEYVSSFAIMAKPISASIGGDDQYTLDELQALTVEGMRTSNALTTTPDLNSYFLNLKYHYGNEIKFVAKRDDVSERIYTAFVVMKKGDYIYPTSTLDLSCKVPDMVKIQDNKYIINPGQLFRYKEGSLTDIEFVFDPVNTTEHMDEYRQYIIEHPTRYPQSNPDLIPNYLKTPISFSEYKELMGYDDRKTIFDTDLAGLESRTSPLYTNPFLIVFTKSPTFIGTYLTVSNQAPVLEFISQNDDSFIQFISYNLNIKRLMEQEKKYYLNIRMVPSVTTETKPVTMLNDITKVGTNDLRVVAVFCNGDAEVGCMELIPSTINDDESMMFENTFLTNDMITSTGKMVILPKTNEIINMTEDDQILVPIVNANIKIVTLYKTAGATNKFSDILPGLDGYLITNIYDTSVDGVTYIKPLNSVRSIFVYEDYVNDITHEFLDCKLNSVPLVKYSTALDTTMFNYFISSYIAQYEFLENIIIEKLKGLSGIDTKFYHTYGKSKNFYIGDNSTEIIDSVNITVKFDVWLETGTDVLNATTEIKKFIKAFIETINDDGMNNLYISNLISSLETKFAYISHLKFKGISGYDSMYQAVHDDMINLDILPKDVRKKYLPELLCIDLNDIILSIY